MDFKKLFRKDDKAVSPVIGVILMVAITVILAAAIGSSVFGQGTTKSAPQANFDIKAVSPSDSTTTAATIKIEHLGGDAVHFESNITKVAISVDGNPSVSIDATGLDTLAAGDVQQLSLKNDTAVTQIDAGQTVDVKFIDSQTNQLICDKSIRF